MDNTEHDATHERMTALLAASTRTAVLSTGSATRRIESLDFLVRGFSAELTAESLSNQLDQLAADLAALTSKKDLKSELGEMESLRLQMAMDRMSKMTSMLSNVMKKISDTAQSITQNLK
ncbi:MAG TPA: hypothetical protein VF491_23420 [Vicinamibacterales bacterium]|jgi:ubiquitin C-terminal hydrolase